MATSQTPALDLSALSFEEADVPARQRVRNVRENPFTDRLRASYENETGYSVTVPAATVQQAVYLIRQAADDLGIGARVVLRDSKGQEIKAGKREGTDKKTGKPKTFTVSASNIAAKRRGNVTVLFEGKERKTRKESNGTTAESAPDTTE